MLYFIPRKRRSFLTCAILCFGLVWICYSFLFTEHCRRGISSEINGTSGKFTHAPSIRSLARGREEGHQLREHGCGYGCQNVSKSGESRISTKQDIKTIRNNNSESKLNTGVKQALNVSVLPKKSSQTWNCSNSDELCKRKRWEEHKALMKKIIQNFTLTENDSKDEYVNLHRYQYLVNSHPCPPRSTHVLLLVHSKNDHFQQRSNIRTTWAHRRMRQVGSSTFRTVFMLGEPSAFVKENKTWKPQPDTLKLSQLWTEIKHEAGEYQDIVLGNFTDHYRNMSHKHIMTLGWAVKHCPDVPYVIKVDDDVVINLYNLLKYFNTLKKTQKNLLTCRVAGGPVQRRSSQKWAVSEKEYPFSQYPPWCLGFAVFMSSDVVRRLYETSREMRPYWVDDIYVTGLLAMKAGVTPTPLAQGHRACPYGIFRSWNKTSSCLFTLVRKDEVSKITSYWKRMLPVEK